MSTEVSYGIGMTQEMCSYDYRVLYPGGFNHHCKCLVSLVGFTIPGLPCQSQSPRAMSRDEKIYPDPENFLPERYLSTEESKGAMDPRQYIFGHGRR